MKDWKGEFSVFTWNDDSYVLAKDVESILELQKSTLRKEIEGLAEATRDEAYNESIICRADVLNLPTIRSTEV